jgi:hypothetical protein
LHSKLLFLRIFSLYLIFAFLGLLKIKQKKSKHCNSIRNYLLRCQIITEENLAYSNEKHIAKDGQRFQIRQAWAEKMKLDLI